MKTITIALGCVIVVGGIIFSLKGQTTYIASEPEVIEKVTLENELEKRIETAQESARQSIEDEAKKVYEESIKQGLLDVEVTVRKEYQAELEAVTNEKEKELDAY